MLLEPLLEEDVLPVSHRQPVIVPSIALGQGLLAQLVRCAIISILVPAAGSAAAEVVGLWSIGPAVVGSGEGTTLGPVVTILLHNLAYILQAATALVSSGQTSPLRLCPIPLHRGGSAATA